MSAARPARTIVTTVSREPLRARHRLRSRPSRTTDGTDRRRWSSSAARPAIALSAGWQNCADEEIAKHAGLKLLGKADTNWTQEGTFQGDVGLPRPARQRRRAYVYEYADGFRGGMRAYQEAGKDAERHRRAAHRRAGPVLRLGKGQRSELQDLLFASGQNFQSRFALTAAMMKKAGKDVRPTSTCLHDEAGGQGHVQSRPAAGRLGLDPIDGDMLKAMFAK